MDFAWLHSKKIISLQNGTSQIPRHNYMTVYLKKKIKTDDRLVNKLKKEIFTIKMDLSVKEL